MTHFPNADHPPPQKGQKSLRLGKASCIIFHLFIMHQEALDSFKVIQLRTLGVLTHRPSQKNPLQQEHMIMRHLLSGW